MITIKSQKEIRLLREGGKILAEILENMRMKVVPGITTKELEAEAERGIKKHSVRGSFLGYQGFPSVLCSSVNDVIVHEVPSKKILNAGDIVSLDLGIIYEGLFTDAAITVGVGKVSLNTKRLIDVTKKSLESAIFEVRDGVTTGDIGNAVQKVVESESFTVVRELVGHGVGYQVHEDPRIPNYGRRGQGEVLREGMVIAIEPMVTMGGWEIDRARDGFGYRTKDGSLSAHFEHTVAVTKDGCVVLTIS